MSTGVVLRNVSKRYSKAADSGGVFDINTTIPAGKFTTLLGQSGSGKTTLLRLLAGFLRPDAGAVLINDAAVASDTTFVPTQHRDLAMVFQSYALWPHMTVFDNVAFGLKARHIPKERIRERVAETLHLVGLADLHARKPSELSGGQQQRTALARSLVLEPSLLLLDEPLSNLDADLRLQTRNQLKALQIKTGITFVYVTHDQQEAFALSDHMIVLDHGRVLQQGGCQDLYSRPRDRRVAQFLGRGGLHLDGSISDVGVDGYVFRAHAEGAVARELGWFCRAVEGMAAGAAAHLVVHSEDLVLLEGSVPTRDLVSVPGTVEIVNFAGREAHVDVRLDDGALVTAYAPVEHGHGPGQAVWVSFAPATAWIFPSDPNGYIGSDGTLSEQADELGGPVTLPESWMSNDGGGN